MKVNKVNKLVWFTLHLFLAETNKVGLNSSFKKNVPFIVVLRNYILFELVNIIRVINNTALFLIFQKKNFQFFKRVF